jgi:histidyl-tRNA synthetase
MKKADKSGAQVALILGEDELNQGKLMVKLLREEGSQESIPLDDVSEVVARILGK